MSDAQRKIDALIHSFVAELGTLVRHVGVAAVESVLGGGAPPSKRGPGRPRSAARPAPAQRAKPSAAPKHKPKAGGKRPAAELARTVDALLAHIKAHPGERIEQIGKHLKLKTKHLALPTQKLLAAKKITKKGQKRSTQYFPAKR